jgi:glycosyltransferase involved in cell wall biosynthesis
MRFAAVIPLYNRARFIAETLDAVLSQSYPAAEVIVVDDGSTDGGAEVVSRYSSRVMLTRFPENRGQQAARNAGIAHTRSEWVAFCDSDDLWLPDYLLRHNELLRADPKINFAFSNFKISRDDEIKVESKFALAPTGYWERAGRELLPAGWVFNRSIAPHTILWHPIFPSATVVSRKLVEEIGGFNPAMRGALAEDGEFTLRCLYRARTGAVPEPTVVIRKHSENDSGDALRLIIDEIRNLDWIRNHHPEAQTFRTMVDAEIRRRTMVAAGGAFAAKRHDLVRELSRDIAWRDRSAALTAKTAIAHLPDSIGIPINTLLQIIAETIKGKPPPVAG